jgi:translocation and assembly module TamB
MTSTTSTKHSRGRRVLGVLSSLVGLIFVVVVAVAVAVLVHLDLPAGRRAVAARVNAVFDSALAGRIRIEHIGGLGLRGVEGVRVRVRDPEGVQVLLADGVSVRASAFEAARSAFLGTGPVIVDVSSVSVGNADVNLDSEPGGELRIARAFASSSTSEPAGPSEPPGRGARIDAPAVRLGHAWAHGTPAGGPLIDAELSDLSSRVHVDTTHPRGDLGPLVSAELDRGRLVARALPYRVDPKGTIEGRFAMPAPNGHGVFVQAAFDGEIGGVPASAEAQMNDRLIDARLDARSDAPKRTSSTIMSELAVREPLSLHAEVHGGLPVVEGRTTLRLGKATLDANAVVEANTTTRVKGTVTARDVNMASISEGAPRTQLGLDASVDVAIDGQGIHGNASIDTLPGTVEQQSLPRVEVRARLAGNALRARARIEEATMPTEVTVDLAPRPGETDAKLVTATVRSHIADLRRVPEVGTRMGGRAELDASMCLLFPEKKVDGRVSVVVSEVDAEDFTFAKLDAKALVAGTIDRLVVDAEVYGRQLVSRNLRLSAIDARARMELAEKSITIRDSNVRAVRGAEKVEANARFVRVAGSNLRVEGIEILGIGDPIRADVSKDAVEIRATVEAPKIDLLKVVRLAGKEDLGVEQGTFGMRGRGVFRRGIARGDVHAELVGFSARSVKGARGLLDASIHDRDVELAVDADAGDIGKLDLRTERLRIDGRADDVRSWKRASGRIRLAAVVDMERAAALAPVEALPVADLRGSLSLRGHVGRYGPGRPPEVRIHAHTNGLAAAGRSAPPAKVNALEVETPPRWRTTDVDLGFDVRSDGLSGLTAVAFRATDRRAALVAFDAKAIVPFDALTADSASAWARIAEIPMSFRVELPSRRLDQLPSIARIEHAEGVVGAVLEGSGTILDPRIRLVAHTRGVHLAAMPIDVAADTDVVLDYDGQRADLTAKVSSYGKELLDGGVHAEVRACDLVAAGARRAMKVRAPAAWKASAFARLASFPLETVPQLADRRIRGRVSGELRLDDLHRDARASGRIELDGLGIGRAEYSNGQITVEATGRRLVAKLRLDQKDGFLDANADAGLAWGASLTPTLEPGQPIDASLVASAFRAAALEPFVENALPVVDGRIDASARVHLVPGKPGAELDGKLVFSNGTLQVAVLGEELRAVTATATFAPDGTVRITDASARGTRGVLRADGAVKLDGMRVAEATANVRIPDRRPLYVAVEGQPVGEISGSIGVKATQSADAKDTLIVVDVPRAAVDLPHITKTGVQSLGKRENIRVGVHRNRHKFVMLPLDAEDLRARAAEAEREESRLVIDVRLGSLRIARGTQLRANVAGNPKITIVNGETTLTGQVNIGSGRLEVQGKKFEIEKGTITWTGETPPNPIVVATAAWTAPDGARVYADFVGPVKTGKVALRSEPPRPKNEILAIMLFGSAEGANPQPSAPGTQPGGTTKAAVGLGGAFLAQGLAQALDDLAGIQATARIDTTRSSNPRPEIEVQLSPKVSVSFAHVIGTPPIAEPDKNFANLEYRFHRNWSLETTFGDRGTLVLDAIWQKRY